MRCVAENDENSQKLEALAKTDVEKFRTAILDDTTGVGLYFFVKHILGYNLLSEEHHLPLCAFLVDGIEAREGCRKLVIAPRGTFKTTISTIGYSLWRLMRAKYILGQDISILITSETLDNAQKFLFETRSHLINTAKFRLYFGDWKPDEAGWTERYIRLKGSPVNALDTSGVNNSRTSRHYQIRINDDMQTEKSRTPGEKQNVIDAYQASQNLYHPAGTDEINVGTPYWADDLIAGLRAGDFGPLDIFMRSALISDKGKPSSKYHWDAENIQINLPSGVRLWFPEVLSLERLSDKRKAQGPYIFSSQYLCTPLATAERIFHREQFRWYDADTDIFATPYHYGDPPRVYYKYLLVDWGGEHKGNHYTAMWVVYVDANGDFFIHDGVIGNFIPNHAVSQLMTLAASNEVHVVAVERNTFQQTYAYWLREQRQVQGIWFELKEVVPHGTHKEDRILSLQPLVEAGKVYINKNIGEPIASQYGELGKYTTEFLKEAEEFPRGKYDDGLDALAHITYADLIKIPFQPTAPTRGLTPEEAWRRKEIRDIFGPKTSEEVVRGALSIGGEW